MSTLRFDGARHTITMLDRAGKVVGTWPAYNNIDSHVSMRHLPDGTYTAIDRTVSHYHPPSPNGSYGSYGIVRFDVPGHSGMGLHSGKAGASYMPGPPHPTMGCIRTSDAAMGIITGKMRSDPVQSVQVMSNSGPAVQAGALKFGAGHVR